MRDDILYQQYLGGDSGKASNEIVFHTKMRIITTIIRHHQYRWAFLRKAPTRAERSQMKYSETSIFPLR